MENGTNISYLAEVVMREGLVELSGEVRDVRLVAVIEVTCGPDREL